MDIRLKSINKVGLTLFAHTNYPQLLMVKLKLPAGVARAEAIPLGKVFLQIQGIVK